MNAADFDRVFGRGRVRMVTGAHVEVFREEAQAGERRRYTKRFLATEDGDFREWTEREWRILARLVGHGSPAVPDIVQFDRGMAGGAALVQTYDAGITVDHWATLLPVERDGRSLAHLYEDCAHWWALARHCLSGLDAIHALDVVHLDLKADNVCIPFAPDDFDAHAPAATLRPRFEQLAFIDFAFSLVSGEPLKTALPIARQHDYVYQSPRLLHALEEGRCGNLLPTQRLDWRCDVYSLAAMLRRYLPDPEREPGAGWNPQRDAAARALVRALLQAHDDERALLRPHRAWIETASTVLAEEDLAESLQRGWRLASNAVDSGADLPTPITRIARPLPQVPVMHEGRAEASATAMRWSWKAAAAGARARAVAAVPVGAAMRPRRRAAAWGSALFAAAALAVPAFENLRRSADEGGAAPTQPVRATQALGTAAKPPAAEKLADATPAPGSIPQMPPQTEGAGTSATPSPTPAAASPAIESSVAVAKPSTSVATPRTAAPVQRPRPSVLVAARASHAKVAAGTPRGRMDVRAASGAAGKSDRSSAIATQSVRPPGRNPARPAPVFAHRFPPVPNDGALLPRPGAAAPSALAARPSAAPALAAESRALSPRVVALLAREGNPPSSANAAAAAGSVTGAIGPTAPPPRVAMAPPAEALDVRYAAPSGPIDFHASAATLMATHVPRIAQQAGRLVRRVLFLASHAEDGQRVDDIRSAASEVRIGARDPLFATEWAAADGRRLSQAAFNERARGNAVGSLELQTQAFGANPGDPEIAGNLAALHLRRRPADAMTARDLALLALALHDRQHPLGRIEDWTTLAIANALTGRDDESRDAWIASLALAQSPGRQCRAAMDAYAVYGERLRLPVESMLQRVHQWNDERSSLCEWPPHGLVNDRPRYR